MNVRWSGTDGVHLFAIAYVLMKRFLWEAAAFFYFAHVKGTQTALPGCQRTITQAAFFSH